MELRRSFSVLVLTIFANAAPVEKQGHIFETKKSFVENGHITVDAELGEYFEGDIILSPLQKQAIEKDDDFSERNGVRGTTLRWPNQTVVYHIMKDDFNEKQLKMIEEGMADIESKSCVKFRPREKNEHAVTIQGLEILGCQSSVGVDNTKDQVLNLAKGCFSHGTIVHEMLHTLGFFHMHSTYDRDDFVKIMWENIQPGKGYNFKKHLVDTVTDFGVPYDYGSILHYGESFFSKNGKKTIIPLKGEKIGQNIGLSESDVKKLNKMYCDKSGEEISYIIKTDTISK